MINRNESNKGKCAVVFGGAGFIGTTLMKSLLNQGYSEIVSADIVEPKTVVNGVQYVYCDVRNPISPILTKTSPDEVYNLAAVHRTPGHAENEYFDTNLKGAENVCAYCIEANTNNLIFTSTMSVYGPSEEAKSESSIPNPVSAYGKSKLEAEKIHHSWVTNNKLRKLTIVRPAVIFGPGENGNFTRLGKALKKRYFFYPGRRNTVKSCGYVGDLVDSISFAVKSDQNMFLYNFSYPASYTVEDICRIYCYVGGCSLPNVTIPLPLLLAIASCFEFMSKVGFKNGVHRARVLKLVRSTNIRPDALLSAGYSFTSDLTDGLERWKSTSPEGEFV